MLTLFKLNLFLIKLDLFCDECYILRGAQLMHDKCFVIIGENIKRFRKQHYYSQEKLAELLDISTNHLYRIEKAKSRISLPLLFRLTEVFQIEVSELLTEEYEKKSMLFPELQEIWGKSNDRVKEIICKMVYNLYDALQTIGI